MFLILEIQHFCLSNLTTAGSAWAQSPCGRDVGDSVEIHPLPTTYHAEFGRSMSNGTSVVIKRDQREKFDPRVPPFKVT